MYYGYYGRPKGGQIQGAVFHALPSISPVEMGVWRGGVGDEKPHLYTDTAQPALMA